MSVFCQAGESTSQTEVMLPRTGRNSYCKETRTGMFSWATENGRGLHCRGEGVAEDGRSLRALFSC